MALSSTPLRKGKKKTKDQEKLVQISPVNTVQEDEAERRSRRSMVDMQKRLSITRPQGSPSLNTSRNIVVSMDVVMEHYKVCQKLFTENKISNQNAWNLKLIDYMKVLVSQDVFGTETMLIGATSLNICTKVFACRVDDLQGKSFQLANTFSNFDKQQLAADADCEENDVDEADVSKENNRPKKKKSKKLLSNQKPTIAKDVKSLLLPTIPKVHNTFFMGHINLDNGSSENLFTNRLPLHHIGHKIMLLDTVNPGMPRYDEEDPSVLDDRETTIHVPIGNFKICPQLSGFEIDEWNPDQEDALLAEINKTQTPDINNELVYDEEGIPVAQLDGSVHDIFADAPEENVVDMDDEPNDFVNRMAVANQEREFITSFCPTETDTYFGDKSRNSLWMKRLWMGPSHWKHKFLKQRASRFSGKTDKQGPAKTKRRASHISEDIDFTDYVPFNMEKKYKVTKKIKSDFAKCTLPICYSLLMPDNRSLMLKPFIPKVVHQTKPNHDEYEHSPYDYNNPNDSQYCSHNGSQHHSDVNNEPLPENDVDFEEHVVNCEATGSANKDMLANLVEAPDMVQQTYISYALRAKKMNMKKLKTTEWEILTEGKKSKTDINVENKHAKNMNFSDLYKILPTKLPHNMSSELSPHLALVGLLHLTHEHSLSLEGLPDLSDIRIKQDKQ